MPQLHLYAILNSRYHQLLKNNPMDKNCSPDTHPLEGQYIVFKHIECDTEDEGAMLVIFQLIHNKLKTIYGPKSDPHARNVHYLPHPENPEQLLTPTQDAVRILQQKGIKEVVSVIRSEVFFGIPDNWQDCSPNPLTPGQETEHWFEYATLYAFDDENKELIQAGIRLRHFDQSKNSFI